MRYSLISPAALFLLFQKEEKKFFARPTGARIAFRALV